MKRVILLLLTFSCYTFANVYFAKLEPYSTVVKRSEVNGKVVIAKENLEGKVANGLVVKIYDKLDLQNLKSTKNSLELTKKMISINSSILKSLKSNMNKKLSIYKRVAPLSSTSINNKNNLFSAYISAKTQYNSTREKILNLKSQKVSLIQKIDTLKDLISKKSIKVDNKYLYSLNVKKGEFVNIGAPLMSLYDVSKGKLTIYLDSDDLKDINKKTIYIDGKKSDLKFNKIWKVADKKYISSYRAEIVTKPFKSFSQLTKVEVK